MSSASEAWAVVTADNLPRVFSVARAGLKPTAAQRSAMQNEIADATGLLAEALSKLSPSLDRYFHHPKNQTAGFNTLLTRGTAQIVAGIRANESIAMATETLIQGHTQRYWNAHPNKAKAAGVAVTTSRGATTPGTGGTANGNTGWDDKAINAFKDFLQEKLMLTDQSGANRNLTDANALNDSKNAPEQPDYMLWAIVGGVAYLAWKFLR